MNLAPQGAAQVACQTQSLKLSPAGPGADGVATTVPLLVTSCISSIVWKSGVAWLSVALVNPTVPRLGMAARPVPPVPISSGVSSIHSAVSIPEVYGVVVENVWPVVRLSITIDQVPGMLVCEMLTLIWLPGLTGRETWVSGSGMISNQAS